MFASQIQQLDGKSRLRKAVDAATSLLTAAAVSMTCAFPSLSALASPPAAEAETASSQSVQVNDADDEREAEEPVPFTLAAPSVTHTKNAPSSGKIWYKSGQSTVLIAEDGSCSKEMVSGNGESAIEGSSGAHKAAAGSGSAKHWTKVTFGYQLAPVRTGKESYESWGKNLDLQQARKVTVWIKSVEQDDPSVCSKSSSRLKLVDESGNACDEVTYKTTTCGEDGYCLLNKVKLRYTQVGKHLAYKKSFGSSGNQTDGAAAHPEYSRHRYSFWNDAGGAATGKSYESFSGYGFNHGQVYSSEENSVTDFSMTVNLKSTGLLRAVSYSDEAETQEKHWDRCWNQWLFMSLESVKGEKVHIDLDGGDIESSSAYSSLFDGTGMSLGNDSTVTLPNPTKEGCTFLGWALENGTGRSVSSDHVFPAFAGEGSTRAKDLSSMSGAVATGKPTPPEAGESVLRVHNGWQGHGVASWNTGYGTSASDLPSNASVEAETTWRAVWASAADLGKHVARYYVDGALVKTEAYDEGEAYTVWEFDGLSGNQTFDGWYATGSSRADRIAASESVTATGDAEYWGWVSTPAVKSECIKYYVDGSLLYTDTAAAGDAYSLRSVSSAYSAAGYSFDGWYASSSKTGKASEGTSLTVPSGGACWYGFTDQPEPTTTTGAVKYYVDGKLVATYEAGFSSDKTYSDVKWNTNGATLSGSATTPAHTEYKCSTCGTTSKIEFTHYYCTICKGCFSDWHEHCTVSSCEYSKAGYTLSPSETHEHCSHAGCSLTTSHKHCSYSGCERTDLHSHCETCGRTDSHYHCSYSGCTATYYHEPHKTDIEYEYDCGHTYLSASGACVHWNCKYTTKSKGSAASAVPTAKDAKTSDKWLKARIYDLNRSCKARDYVCYGENSANDRGFCGSHTDFSADGTVRYICHGYDTDGDGDLCLNHASANSSKTCSGNTKHAWSKRKDYKCAGTYHYKHASKSYTNATEVCSYVKPASATLEDETSAAAFQDTKKDFTGSNLVKSASVAASTAALGASDVAASASNGSRSKYGYVGNPSGTSSIAERSAWYADSRFTTKADSWYSKSELEAGVNLYASTKELAAEGYDVRYVVNGEKVAASRFTSCTGLKQGDAYTVQDRLDALTAAVTASDETYSTGEGWYNPDKAVFLGWYSDEDCTQPVDPGSEATMGNADVTYYGRVVPAPKTVTYRVYDDDTGDVLAEWQSTLSYGAEYSLPSYAVPDGYMDCSDGMWLNPATGEKVRVADPFTAGIDDVEWEAYVKKKTDWATVTYVVDGEVVAEYGETEMVGSEYELHNHIREGYSFDGWYSDEACTQGQTAAGSTATLSGDVTWYGQTTRDVVYRAVRYYVDGDLYKTETLEDGDDYAVADAPTADGVEFVGWYCNRDGLTDYYDGAVYSGGDARENITCDTTYCGYTRPIAEYHQVHLFLDGKEYYATQTEMREAGLTDLAEGSSYTLPTIEPGEHWSVDGWHRVYPDADGNVATRDTSAEATAMGSVQTMGDSDEWWAAERDWDDMTIRFVVDGVERPDLAITAKRGYTVDLPTWDPGAGYSFDGWYDDEAMTSRPADYDDYGGTAAYFADDAVLYGATAPIMHTVTYVVNGKTVKAEQAQETRELDLAYDRSGDSFGGELSAWHTDERCTQEIADGKLTVPAGDVTVYAYTVHTWAYVVDGVEQPDLALHTRYGSQDETESYEPETGHSFDGWYDDESMAGGKTAPQTVVTVTGDATWYGQTTPNDYTVRFVVDGVEQPGLAQAVTFGGCYALPETGDVDVDGNRWFDGIWYADEAMTGGASAAGSQKELTTAGDVTWYGQTREANPGVRYHIDGELVSSYDVTFPSPTDELDASWDTPTATLSGSWSREYKAHFKCKKCGKWSAEVFEHYWCPVCGKCTTAPHVLGSPAAETFASPNYPSSYGNSASTSKEISFPGAASIKVTVADGAVTESTSFDYFSVYNSSGTLVAGGKSSKNGVVLGGKSFTESFTLAGDYAKVTFESDSSVVKAGAQLTFEPVYDEATVVHSADEEMHGETETFASPNYPSSYGNSASTSKEIRFPGAASIKVTVADGAVTESTSFDYFSVYNSSGTLVAGGKSSENGVVLGGKSFTESFTLAGDYAKVTFESDSSVVKAGAQLTFEPVYSGPVAFTTINVVAKKIPAGSGELGSGNVTAASDYGAGVGDPVGSYDLQGKTLSKWYDAVNGAGKGTHAAAASYDAEALERGVDLYAFTSTGESQVTFKVNGEDVGTSTVPAAGTVPGSDLESAEQRAAELFPGGEVVGWYTDPDFSESSKVDVDTWQPGGDETLYGYTLHDVTVTMDPGTSGEESFTLAELTGGPKSRYGTTATLPATARASKTLTKQGCEDWLTRPSGEGVDAGGKYYSDERCTKAVTRVTVGCGTTVYGYNAATLTLDATTASKRLDKAAGGKYQLYTAKVTGETYATAAETTLAGELAGAGGFTANDDGTASRIFRYGASYSVDSMADVHWLNQSPANADGYTGGDRPQLLSRRARGVAGAYSTATPGKSDKAVGTWTVTASATLYKAWVQAAYDGAVTG